MSVPNRSTLIYGPAKFTLTNGGGSTSWFTEDETVELKPAIDLKDQKVNGMVLDRFVDDQYVTASIPVDPRLTTDRVAVLWPYTNPAPGTALFGDSDYPLVITDSAARVYTLPAAAIVKMPSLRLGVSGLKVGPVEILALHGNGMAWTDGTATTGALLQAAGSGGTFADSTMTAALLNKLRQPYTIAYGATLVDIDVHDEIEIDFELELGTIKTQAMGTHQKFVKSVGCAVKFYPANQTYDKILGMLTLWGANNKRGRSLAASHQTVTIKGVNTGTTVFTLTKGAIHTSSFRFGSADQALRDGQVAMVSTRALASGATDALFAFTALN